MLLRSLGRRWAARSGVAAVALVTLTAAMQAGATAAPRRGSAPPAGPGTVAPATDPYSPAYRHPARHGAIPTRQVAAKMRAWAAAHPALRATALTTGKLRYGGGINGVGVTSGHEKVYLVFYGSQWGARSTNSHGDTVLSGDPAGMAPYLQQLFKGLGTGGERWSGVTTQYCDGVAKGATSCPASSTQHVAYPKGGALAGVWADEHVPSPAVATEHALAAEAVRAAGHFGNKTAAANRDAQYVVISPTGTDPDNWLSPSTGFCAWHDWNGDTTLIGGPATSPYGPVAFTNLPYVTNVGASCGAHFVNPGKAGALDGVSIVEGHEYAETVTDQEPPGGWIDSTGEESADKCAWIPAGISGGAADLPLTTGTFAMQSVWANDASRCEFSHPIVPN